jgi:5-methylcytosine-specific restriction protein B
LDEDDGGESQADEIRRYVLENYIKPARLRGDATVTITIGALNNEMGLHMAWPNICQALEGRLFLRLANVPAPAAEGPKQSTTRKLTYSLVMETKSVPRQKQSPTNLILYGPPGTGKTYRTAYEAVLLCDGTVAFDESPKAARRCSTAIANLRRKSGSLSSPSTRIMIMRALSRVCVLRQATARAIRLASTLRHGRASSAKSVPSPTRPGPGPCRQRVQPVSTFGPALLEDGPGRDRQRRRSLRRGAGEPIYRAWLGWDDRLERRALFDLRRHQDRVAGQNPDDPTPSNWTQTWPFRAEMKIGDIVIVPYGNTAFRAIAEVTGDYRYVPEAEGTRTAAMRWLLTLEEPLPLDTIVDGNFTMRTLYPIATKRVNLSALARLIAGDEDAAPAEAVAGEPEQFVLIIDEINRANISKVFGELITLIEPDKRLGMANALSLTLPYSKKRDFGVPANLHIVGTMNTADRSIALLDTALRRRFTFREMAPRIDLLGTIDGIDLRVALSSINDRIEYLIDREHRIGHAFFMGCENREAIDLVMRDKVIPFSRNISSKIGGASGLSLATASSDRARSPSARF